MGIAIVARGISARGPRGCAFANVSVDVAAGQLAVIAGPGGSGRTSLLLALAGRMQLVTGELEIGGYRLPADARAVHGLVAVAQARPAVSLDEHLRVADLIAERAMIGGHRPASGTVTKALGSVGFDAAHTGRIGELPPDQRTLLAVGLAVAEQPEAIVVDDADHQCDPDQRQQVWEALWMLAQRGCTVLASSTRVPDTLDTTDVSVTRLAHPQQNVKGVRP